MLVLCLSVLCWSVSEGRALSTQYENAFTKALQKRVKANDKYVWGGKNPNRLTFDTKAKEWKKGLDCQGLVLFSAREARIPGVGIVTSRDMARGLGGWVGDDLSGSNAAEWLRNTKSTDLVWWTLSKDRPYGHVGVLLHNSATGFPAVAHASSSRGVVMDEIQGWVIKQMTKVRRLTIGDKK